MRFITVLFFGSLIAIASCNNSTPPRPDDMRTTATSSLRDTGTQMLMQVVNGYFGLKNALVLTDSRKADSTAANLGLSAKRLQTFVVKDTVNYAAIAPYITAIMDQTRMLHVIDDISCDKQRIVFDIISTNLYAMLKDLNLKNSGVYHEHCPVAFDRRGAFWLSSDAEIKNPYFGKKLLECGEVADSL